MKTLIRTQLLFACVSIPHSVLSYRSSSAVAAFANLAAIRKRAAEEDIVVQPRKYGYRTEPFQWHELVQIIDEEKNLAKLSRSLTEQKTYVIYQEEMRQEWRSPYDSILVNKFGFKRHLVESSNERTGACQSLWEASPRLNDIKEVQKVLCLNDFPYFVDDDIEHWCLWKLCQEVTDEDVKIAKNDLRSMHGDVKDFLSWRNPPNLQSLPDIDHIHILCHRELQTAP